MGGEVLRDHWLQRQEVGQGVDMGLLGNVAGPGIGVWGECGPGISLEGEGGPGARCGRQATGGRCGWAWVRCGG